MSAWYTKRSTTAFILLGIWALNKPDIAAVGGHPSRSFVSGEVRTHPARFAFYEHPDCRLLFCDRATLLERIRRSVVIVDDLSTAMVKGADASAREYAVGKAMTVGDVLKRAGLKHWDGGQPQLRLIKRNAIIQSSIATDTSPGGESPKIFLSQKVEPGDVLIITPRS